MNSYTTILALSVAALALIGIGWWIWRLRRRHPDARDALAAVSIESLRDILVPDGMGGQIYVEHLLLTTRGIAVIDVKEFAGVVFASDRMQEWTVIGEGRRFGFPNPQGTLYDRVAAVRQLARNVPVEGFIVFSSRADFSKGRPKHVMLASELEKHFRKPSPDDRERLSDAYAPHWQRLRTAAEPADTVAG